MRQAPIVSQRPLLVAKLGPLLTVQTVPILNRQLTTRIIQCVVRLDPHIGRIIWQCHCAARYKGLFSVTINRIVNDITVRVLHAIVVDTLDHTQRSLSIFLTHSGIGKTTGICSEACGVSILHMTDIHVGFHRHGSAKGTLRQNVTGGFKICQVAISAFHIFGRGGNLVPIGQTQPAFTISERPISVIWIMSPFPYQIKIRTIGLVFFGDRIFLLISKTDQGNIIDDVIHARAFRTPRGFDNEFGTFHISVGWDGELTCDSSRLPTFHCSCGHTINCAVCILNRHIKQVGSHSR